MSSSWLGKRTGKGIPGGGNRRCETTRSRVLPFSPRSTFEELAWELGTSSPFVFYLRSLVMSPRALWVSEPGGLGYFAKTSPTPLDGVTIAE